MAYVNIWMTKRHESPAKLAGLYVTEGRICEITEDSKTSSSESPKYNGGSLCGAEEVRRCEKGLDSMP